MHENQPLAGLSVGPGKEEARHVAHAEWLDESSLAFLLLKDKHQSEI